MDDDTQKRLSRLVNPSVLQKSTMQKTAQLFAAQQAAVERVAGITAMPSSAKQMADIVDKAFAGINIPGMQFAELNGIKAAVERAAGITAMPSSAKQMADIVAAQQATMDKAFANFVEVRTVLYHQPALDRLARSFYRAIGAAAQTEVGWLSELTNQVSDINLDDMDTEDFEGDLEAAADQLDKMEGGKGFFSSFSKLHPFAKIVLYFLILQIILPQLNSVSANLLMPKIESFLDTSKASDREKIREIKKIPLSLNDMNTDQLRFITGNNVRLRALPSTKSELLDELVLGQVVTVLSKRRNWIEVTYEYGNGEILSGWVFTKYTARFVK